MFRSFVLIKKLMIFCFFLYTVFQPRILDDYSDPFDVKKEIELSAKDEDATESEAQFLNVTLDTTPSAEDDYSVPYELKCSDGGK